MRLACVMVAALDPNRSISRASMKLLEPTDFVPSLQKPDERRTKDGVYDGAILQVQRYASSVHVAIPIPRRQKPWRA
jgi:hypothetical protein